MLFIIPGTIDSRDDIKCYSRDHHRWCYKSKIPPEIDCGHSVNIECHRWRDAFAFRLATDQLIGLADP